MRYFMYLFFIICLATSSNAQRAATIASAEVSFLFVNNDVSGTLSGFTSTSVIDTVNIEQSLFAGSVDVATIDTNNSIRNWSLKRSKYFDANTYPTISFKSTDISVKEAHIQVQGVLTIKDITKEVTFNFVKNKNQLVGKATIYSADFGIAVKSDRLKNKVDIKVVLSLN